MCAQHQKTSVELLNTARKTASETANYSSEATREAIVKKFQDVFDGNKPYDWQVDMTEALLLGLDCVAISGTGAGRMMPFGMTLLMDESRSKMVIVLSPLNDLKVEQV